MIHRTQILLLARLQEATKRPDRGLETLEYVAWSAGIILVIGALMVLLKGSLESFWNSIDFGNVLP